MPVAHDFHLVPHGSIILLRPISIDAREWCMRNLPRDCPTFASAFAIETRYADTILLALEEENFSMKEVTA